MPLTLFSIGTTPATDAPSVTSLNTWRKPGTPIRSASPKAARTASSAKAPGSPEKAIRERLAATVGSASRIASVIVPIQRSNQATVSCSATSSSSSARRGALATAADFARRRLPAASVAPCQCSSARSWSIAAI